MTANNEEDVIDLTCSYTFADHGVLSNGVIDLVTDDSFRLDTSNYENSLTGAEQPRRTLAVRKRRSPNPRTTTNRVRNNNATPENEIKKKARKSKICEEKTPDEPEEKKAKLETTLGCCPICFDEFGSKPLASTRCGHIFCHDCIKLALKTEARCPTCRTRLKGATAVHPIFLS